MVPIHVTPLKRNAAARKSFPDLLKLGSNIVGRVIDLYILNKLKRDEIHNDPGASFTSIERVGKRITKRAMAVGEEKLIHEIEWIVRLSRTPFRSFLPKIYEYSTEPGNVYYTMRYYDFANLRAVITLEMNADYFLRARWRHLFDMMRTHLWTEANSSTPSVDFFVKTHRDKYYSRMQQALSMEPSLQPVFAARSLQINGRHYLPPDRIIETVIQSPDIVAQLTPDKTYLSHGDVHTNNILCGIAARHMILLDCRGKAPDGTDYFDVAYDIGKVYHDLRSLYSLIERHHYTLFYEAAADGVRIDFRFNQSGLVERFHRNFQWVETIIDEFADEFGNLRCRADFNEAMLYLTMVPLHLKERSEGLVCFVTGVQRINEWLQRYHPALFAQLAESSMSPSDRLAWETPT